MANGRQSREEQRNVPADFLQQTADFVRGSATATLVATIVGIGLLLKLGAEIIEEIL
ncbi:MAG: hypothetical protein ACYCW6_31550 [Candidatus Xenobia bacterium]